MTLRVPGVCTLTMTVCPYRGWQWVQMLAEWWVLRQGGTLTWTAAPGGGVLLLGSRSRRAWLPDGASRRQQALAVWRVRP